ncbi:MAG: chemotaxis protein CheC [Lachnospiraceae bacterium]|nr:chemotaxis protein CheC [Lachnospiraceae bacterium]
MGELSFERLTSQYLDILKEIGNIGAGNATSALAQMLDTKVDMNVPQVRLLDFKEVGDLMGGADQIMAGIYLAVEGDIDGSIMFLSGVKSAKILVNKMMQQEPEDDSEGFTEIELSALQEIGNIITGSYLNSMSMLTNLKMIPSVPYIAVDMAGAILSVPAIEFGMMGDYIMLIETKFFDDSDLNGYFILLPDMESWKKILKALGVSDVDNG